MSTKEITILGFNVSVSAPYAAEAVMNEAEAKALNQSRAEGVANNLRGKIKDIKEGDGSEDTKAAAVQTLVTEYDAEYAITLGSVGAGRKSMTPLEKECKAIAVAHLSNKLREAGTTKKAYVEAHSLDVYNDKVAEVAANPAVLKLAEKNIAERAKIAELDLTV